MHKLREVLAITDNTVMRQGAMVEHVVTADTNKEQLAELMVGRKVRLKVDKSEDLKELIKVDNLQYFDDAGVERVKSVSFGVRQGEVVGIAGVSGNGQSEILALLSGIIQPYSGSEDINGSHIDKHTVLDPQQVRAIGVGYIQKIATSKGL